MSMSMVISTRINMSISSGSRGTLAPVPIERGHCQIPAWMPLRWHGLSMKNKVDLVVQPLGQVVARLNNALMTFTDAWSASMARRADPDPATDQLMQAIDISIIIVITRARRQCILVVPGPSKNRAARHGEPQRLPPRDRRRGASLEAASGGRRGPQPHRP